MVYPAEHGLTVVVKMCVLQITCCHILNREQEEVPLSQAIVFITQELNACREVFSRVVPLRHFLNHLEDVFELDDDNKLHLFCLHYAYGTEQNLLHDCMLEGLWSILLLSASSIEMKLFFTYAYKDSGALHHVSVGATVLL